MDPVRRWLAERPTPLLWLFGPAGSGKTAAVRAAVRATGLSAHYLELAAFEPDDAFAEVFGKATRLTAKVLLELPRAHSVLVLDSLDTLQQSGGTHASDVTDCRFRQLLRAVVKGTVPGMTIVTSRAKKPSIVPDDSVTMIEMQPNADPISASLPLSGSQERRVLEFAALSRRAIDTSAVALMSGFPQRTVERILAEAAANGLLRRFGDARYHIPDPIRSSIIPTEELTDAVREAAIEGLNRSGSEPTLLLQLLVDHGRIGDAIQVYWERIGNFSRLNHEGRNHFGALLCRRLNDGLSPDEVSPRLRDADGAWAVMNDWSQYANVIGDAHSGVLAAESAYRLAPGDRPPWDAAILAAHAGQAHLAAGNLWEAMTWSQRGWSHARMGMRKTQGIAVREVMDAYDWSANTMARIYFRAGQPAEVRRLIDDLVAIHRHARDSIREFNESSVFPLSGPEGPITPSDLAEGRLAAILAFGEGRVLDIAPPTLGAADTVAGREIRTLMLRAAVADAREDAEGLLLSLRKSAEERDDTADECELAGLAHSRRGTSGHAALALIDVYLARAEACGLGEHWRDMELARAQSLCDSDDRAGARRAAESALFGADGVRGAIADSDWTAGRHAVAIIEAAGGQIDGQVRARIDEGKLPDRPSPPAGTARRPHVSTERGVAARRDMHAAALAVLDTYEKDGMPFAVYFRKFDIDVLHGPFDLGPKLTENALRDALPPAVEVVTIQQQSDISSYDLGASRMRREAPALALGNDAWAAVASALIQAADLIVSEPLMLSDGVRLELQMIYDVQRWDRTVLVLPPLDSYLATIDNDPLIQMFPRCIWADSLHDESLTDSPVMTDLLARIRAIAAVPVETRRGLIDPAMRQHAFPIELLPVAEHLEMRAQLGATFNEDSRATRYYGFWQMFRAAAIRGVRNRQGDVSPENVCSLARCYLQMSHIMLDHATEGERFVLQAEPAEAKALVQSAHRLLGTVEDTLWVQALRGEAEDSWDEVSKLEALIRQHPDRFEIKSSYGPLVKAKSGQSRA